MSKIIGLNGKALNGGPPSRAPHAVAVPDLPTNPTDLDAVANGIEGMGIQTATEAFMVAVLRSLAQAMRRIEALEEPQASRTPPPKPSVTEMRTAIRGISVTRGRPKKADALSNTDRQRAFRARKRAAHG